MIKINKILLWALGIIIIGLIAGNITKSVQVGHLDKENAKFKQEIEYLKGSNELLREDNVKFQDALWNYHEKKMKESAE